MIERWRAALRSRSLRLTLSVLLLTMSVVFAADFFNLRGDQDGALRDARKLMAESLAIQLSVLASVSDREGIRHTVSAFVNRDKNVTAAALVDEKGETLAEYGRLSDLEGILENSSSTQMTVPIFDGQIPWGEVRVSFLPEDRMDLQYFAFVLVGCFVSFLLFLRKALAQLNPSKVVPGRVNSAFDMLSEGVVILDDQLRILLVNESVAQSVGKQVDDLTGQNLNEWSWEQSGDWQAPWVTALHSGLSVANQPLRLRLGDEVRTFMVSASAVGNDEEGMRGVLVTLDDMTVIEQKNAELAQTLRELRRSQEAITSKNKELEELATRDPLTGLANRRALLSDFDREFAKRSREEIQLSCIMVDIDHFKKINDTYGHAVGDEVICAVANCLTDNCRDIDIVGRYGGEEFVVVLPGQPLKGAMELAERLRETVGGMAREALVPVDELGASFGVTTLDASVESPAHLLDQADQALYVAKQGGRNRVVAYDPKVTKLKVAGDEEKSPGNVVTDDATLSRLVELEAIVGQRTKDLEALQEFDVVTGIPSRVLFLQRIDSEVRRAQRFGSKIGVLSWELKDMERIVASLGIQAGEQLVIDVVQRVQDGLRDTDVVSEISQEHSMSRITSNEFGVLLTDLSEAANAMPVITRLRHLVTKPFAAGDQKVRVGVNIGIAILSEKGESAVELLEAAGRARAKASLDHEKVAHSFSSAKLDEESKGYIQLESDLYDAFDNNLLEVHFQPIYDLQARRMSAMEALVRWPHPEKGYIPPDSFIPLAESNGLIHGISRFVLEQSVAQLQRWREMGMTNMQVAVNISPLQLRAPGLVAELIGTMKKARVPTKCLALELTESSVIDSPQRARVVLGQLRKAGVSIAMDDFGTGYSSLALLADLPLDCVKIDRSFVNVITENQRSRAVVESVINMARALQLKVIAEGVETNEQLAMLRSLGCNEVQGFLISKPMPPDEAVEFLRQQYGSKTG
jgi:diguanylate cyclase (GGDEF)-like protein